MLVCMLQCKASVCQCGHCNGNSVRVDTAAGRSQLVDIYQEKCFLLAFFVNLDGHFESQVSFLLL